METDASPLKLSAPVPAPHPSDAGTTDGLQALLVQESQMELEAQKELVRHRLYTPVACVAHRAVRLGLPVCFCILHAHAPVDRPAGLARPTLQPRDLHAQHPDIRPDFEGMCEVSLRVGLCE